MPARSDDLAIDPAVPGTPVSAERRVARSRTGSPGEGERVAGLGAMLLYLAIPPAVGFTSASWFLTDKTAVPWVLLTAMVLGTVSFLLAGPLGRRSRHFALAGYRRAAELSVLVGLTCVAVVAYTAGIYLLLGFDEPWADQLISAFLGG